jgi:hypothetical protein
VARKTEPVDAERVRDIAEAVYRDRLGERDVARMIAQDGDGGRKLRARSGCYVQLVAPFCRALGVDVPRRKT